MNRKRLFLLASILLWAIALAAVVKLALDRLPISPWGNPIGGDVPLQLSAASSVGQAFVAPLPGLYRIDVTLGETAAKDTSAVTFHLKREPDAGQDIWTTTVPIDRLQGSRSFSVDFPVLRDSQGQSYYFYLDLDAAARDAAIAIGYGPDAMLDGASAYVDHQPVSGDVQFQSFYSLRTRERLDLLLTRMAQGRPYMFGTKGFYVGLGVVYGLVLVVFLLYTVRTLWAERKEET